MEIGNYDYPLDLSNRDEIGYLATRFDEMRRQQRVYISSLEDAARVDGASEWRIFWQIVMPLVRPAWTPDDFGAGEVACAASTWLASTPALSYDPESMFTTSRNRSIIACRCEASQSVIWVSGSYRPRMLD